MKRHLITPDDLDAQVARLVHALPDRMGRGECAVVGSAMLKVAVDLIVFAGVGEAEAVEIVGAMHADSTRRLAAQAPTIDASPASAPPIDDVSSGPVAVPDEEPDDLDDAWGDLERAWKKPVR